ncbi:MAG: Nramp family divalent metal transporter [Methanomicrobiaceae archaeon]|nr:Nramp family divalent metal transporter [Methanomicrobiaceae archaeon]
MIKDLKDRIKSKYSDYFLFLGPGLLLAVAAAGESGLGEVVEIGAHFGFGLVWVVIVTLIFKFAFTTGIARYTLATGETIFDGLRKIPGPRNWGVVFVLIVYLLEMFAFAGMLLMGGIFLDYLIPGVNAPWLLAIISLAIILFLLWKDSYERIETIVVIIAIVLFSGIILALSQFYLHGPAILEGMVPSIPPGSAVTIMALMGSVGSGLNILLYSVWLHEKTGGEFGESYFRRYIKSVKLDLLLAFSLVAVITVIFMGLGVSGFVVSYLGHGEDLTVDAVISQVLYIVGILPYGITAFLIFGFIIMFGATLSGMDGRARAVSSMIKRALELDTKEETLYRGCLVLFTALIIISFFFFTDPSILLRHSSAIASIMFAVFGFAIIYLDRQLPKYSRGSRLWITIMGAGSALFLYIALILENGILEFGLPLVERLLLIGFVLYLLSKTEIFEKMLDGRADTFDKLWMAAIFGAISIYGTYRGIQYGEIILNFRDLGPMVAGLLGGPVVGGLAGIIGAVYRYSLGGWTATACMAATIFAGLFAGFFSHHYKGRINYYRAAVLVIIVECIHILLFVPLMVKDITMEQYIWIIDVSLLPMIIANITGLMIFIYLVNLSGRYLHDYWPWNKKELQDDGAATEVEEHEK